MARDLVSGDFGQVGVAVTPAYPCTLSCWFNSDSATTSTILMFLGDASSPVNWLSLGIDGTAGGDPVYVFHGAAGGVGCLAYSTNGFTAGVWHHIIGTFTRAGANTTVEIWLDGTGYATNTTATGDISGVVDRTALGGARDSSPGLYFDGQLAEAAFYNVALGTAEALSLAAGFAPPLVRPDALAAYWPAYGQSNPEPDRMAGNDLTWSADRTPAAHPRIIYPTGPQIAAFTAAPSGHHPIPEENPPHGPGSGGLNPTQPLGMSPRYERGEELWLAK